MYDRERHKETVRRRRARLKAQLNGEFTLTAEEQEYRANPAAFGPQSWWPRLEWWAIKFGPWLNAKPQRCTQTQ